VVYFSSRPCLRSLLARAVWESPSSRANWRRLVRCPSASRSRSRSYRARAVRRSPGPAARPPHGTACPVSCPHRIWAASISRVSQRMAARSTTFLSSRTLPGQACRASLSRAASVKEESSLRRREASWKRKCSAKSGMSSARSRNGGMVSGKTLIR